MNEVNVHPERITRGMRASRVSFAGKEILSSGSEGKRLFDGPAEPAAVWRHSIRAVRRKGHKNAHTSRRRFRAVRKRTREQAEQVEFEQLRRSGKGIGCRCFRRRRR